VTPSLSPKLPDNGGKEGKKEKEKEKKRLGTVAACTQLTRCLFYSGQRLTPYSKVNVFFINCAWAGLGSSS
jgi:hypothetical protein